MLICITGRSSPNPGANHTAHSEVPLVLYVGNKKKKIKKTVYLTSLSLNRYTASERRPGIERCRISAAVSGSLRVTLARREKGGIMMPQFGD